MERKKEVKKNVFILGIGSDIGAQLALRYLNQGYAVMGTYRHRGSVRSLAQKGICLFQCDVAKKPEIKECINKIKKTAKPWDIFISCVGTMEPIGKFFDVNFNEWENSIIVNSTSQLRFLHELYPYRRKNTLNHVVFFAGGGTNNPFTNYSAYCVSKIMLIKMCELLDDENNDLHTFIVGPGVVKTKIHAETLRNRLAAGSNYSRTKQFLKSNILGTDYKDIFDCINWCIDQGREVSGGRNFSVVHDAWKKRGESFVRQLRADSNKFKLRRFKNSNNKGG
ncbi:MAG: SDR family NAD(P)-dependent oxidoreductase [Candidatus Omnitrophica bacterium]|nr:SDR family NAD(P)-dependent oxidoreductase [Candidatus Omnitrophota bacterium]